MRSLYLAAARPQNVANDVPLTKPAIVLFGRLKAFIIRSRAKFYTKNMFKHDWSDADIVFCYLLPHLMKKLEPKFSQLKPGAKVVSHAFEIPGWKPARHLVLDKRRKIGNIYVYQVK